MKHIKSATDYGWEVRSSDAMKALDMWVEAVGEEKALEDIAYAMGDNELRDNIEYIAEQWEFTDLIEDIDNTWDKYEEAKEVMGVTELLNSLTSAMGYDELAECLAYIFRQHDFREWDEIESSRKPVKSSLMDEVMNFETTEDLDIYLRNKGYERRDGNGFFEYGIPNQPAELRVTEDNGGFIVDIKALTNSRRPVKSGRYQVVTYKTYGGDDGYKERIEFDNYDDAEHYANDIRYSHKGVGIFDLEDKLLVEKMGDFPWTPEGGFTYSPKLVEDAKRSLRWFYGDDEEADRQFEIWKRKNNIKSARKITSGLDPYLCCPNCGEPELFENIKEHNVKCYNCGNTISYDELKNLKRYISPHSKIKSARYIATNPESGEVLGSADTYEEAVNEWGEDVTITDSMAIKSNANLSGEVYHWVVNAGALDELSEDERNDYMACAEHIASKIDNPEEFGYSDETPEDANRFVRAIAYELQHNKDLIGSGCDKVEPVSPSRPVPKNLPPYKDNSENKKKKEENKDGKSFADMLKEEQEKQKANSSKQSNHEFYTNIVSSLLSKDITEDQAVEQIASRNNVNKGYAKHILNSIVNDNQYIKSGIMDIADDINKEVNLNDDLDAWAETYIKDTGKSNTLAGEILRAYKQIEYRWFNDGDKIGIGYGKETVNPAARFLVEKCTGWTEVANIEEMLSGDSDINSDNDYYNEWVEDAKYSLEDYLRNNDDWFHTPNKQDMWESSTEDDKDTSVNECYIMDDNNNEYWFYNRDGWVCTGITYYNDQQFDVGDVLDEDDVNYYISEPDDNFADFEDDSGFEYSAENNDGEWSITDVRIPEALAEEGDRWDISDFEDYDIYDPNGNEISIKDLY